jgi:murein L,D-transpeptidase YcbB/YkuD
MRPHSYNRLVIRAVRRCHQAYLIIAVCFGLGACTHFNGTANAVDVMSEENNQKTSRLDSSQTNFEDLFASSATLKFYRLNNFAPVWLKNKANTSLADSLLYIIRIARTFGLQPNDYHLSELEEMMKMRDAFDDSLYTSKMDLLLTDAFFRFTNNLKYGRLSPDSLRTYSSSITSDSLLVSLLQSALLKNELSRTFAAQEPKYVPYRLMKRLLGQLIMTRDSLERKILLSGFEPDLSDVSARVRMLEVNMERWRWEQSLTGKYIVVNIPSYVLEVFDDDSVVFTSKVIVGATKNQTPELDGLIKTFTIFPHWNVTRNIAVKEMLPSIKADSMYLQSHHIW